MKLEKFYRKKDDFVTKEISLEKVIDKMYTQHLRYVVIVDSKNHPIGILTERDILFLYNTNVDFKQTNAYEISTKQLVKADKIREIEYALNFMIDHNVRRVVVVDSKHKYLGVVEQEDIIFELESKSTRNKLKIFEVLLNESKALGVDKDTSLQETIGLMKDKNFGSILVTEHGKSIGILTETDILNLAKNNIDKNKRVKDYMHMPLYKVSIQASLHDCVELMRTKAIRRVIVEEINEDGDIIDYIITSSDILNNLQGNYSKFLEAKLLSQKNTFENLEDIVIEAYDFEKTQVISWVNQSAKTKLAVNIDDNLDDIVPKNIIEESLQAFSNSSSFTKERVEIKGRLYRYSASSTYMFGSRVIKILLSDFTELYLTNRKLAEQVDVMSDSINEQDAMQKEIFNQNAIGIGYISVRGEILFINQYISELLGYQENELIGMNIKDITYKDDMETSADSKQTLLSNSEDISLEKRYLHKDGTPIWVHLSMSYSKSKTGHVNYIIGFIKDIRKRKNQEERLLLAGAVYDNTSEGIIITNRDLTIKTINSGFEKIFGYSKKELLGQHLDFFISSSHSKNFYKKIWLKVLQKGYWQGEISGKRKNGETFPQWLNITTIEDNLGKVINYIGVLSDISMMKKSEEKLEFLAHHDPLTNLPNRLLLLANLKQAIKRAKREKHKVAIMFLDLDRFKEINDTFGHSYGDEILKIVTTRFKSVMREEDTIARIGGDEFIMLVEELNELNDFEVIIDKVLRVFDENIFVNSNSFNLTASIGVSIFPDDGLEIEDLIKNADTAMYQAKDEGRNTYRFYTQEMTQNLFAKMLIKNEIDRALKNDEFILHYQPQISINSNQILGIEALVRWEHPQMGLLFPDKFISEAESTKQIIALGQVVLEKACVDTKKWIDEKKFAGRISVNVSAVQIKQNDFYDMVIETLAKTGLSGNFLELELTESSMMENPKESILVFKKLRNHGITLAIDDFGTGYSSLSYLKNLPIDKLKIDRSFIMDIPNDKGDMVITKTIIAMAKSLGYSVIAEGIETQAQHMFLKSEGCYEGQGYLYSRPIPLDALENFLKLKKENK